MPGHSARRGDATHRAPLTPYPSTRALQELFLEHGFIGSVKSFGRVRYQHVDATGTPIDNG